MLLLWQDPGPPGLSLSILGVADDSGGAVGVWAEQGCDGVVAMARVVGCENHLGERREERQLVLTEPRGRSCRRSVHRKLNAKLVIFLLLSNCPLGWGFGTNN